MTFGYLARLALIAALTLGVPAFGITSQADGDAIRTALNQGRADDALRLLNTALQQNANDAEALNLQCRVFFAEERWDDAIQACGRAVQIAGNNSNYHLWLGRAYGEKADRVAFVTAYKLAKEIRAQFETAASLDPKNADALADLGQYYVEAPAILGGGTGKAEEVARQLESLDPAQAHDLRGRVAEQKKDYVAAEKEFRAKLALSHPQSQAWMDLGSFYRRRERLDAMVATLQSGAAADQAHGPALADGAETLIDAEREPQLAMEWMRQYLASNALSEEAPAFAVHARLGILLKQQGDAQGAQQEFAAAHALAKNFVMTPKSATNTGR